MALRTRAEWLTSAAPFTCGGRAWMSLEADWLKDDIEKMAMPMAACWMSVAYSLLKTMIDNWQTAFRDGLKPIAPRLHLLRRKAGDRGPQCCASRVEALAASARTTASQP